MTASENVSGSGEAGAAGSPGVEIERVFDAPRELVWQAWTDPAQMARWYGPDNFSYNFV